MVWMFLLFNQSVLDHSLFSSLQRWFLTAKIKETTSKSIPVVISSLTLPMQDQWKYLKVVRMTKAMTRQNTTCVWYLLTLPISSVS